MTTLSFSIVLPVYKQADHIAQVVQSYTRELVTTHMKAEFILVAYDQDERTVKAAQKVAKAKKNVRVITVQRSGWGNQVRAGIQASKGSHICFTNTARTQAKDLTLLLLYAQANSTNVIKANRKIRDYWIRRVGSLGYNIFCRALFGFPYWDVNGTPKIFPRSAKKLLSLTEPGDLLDLEFVVTCFDHHYPLLEVPILSNKRHGGKSTTNYQSAINMFAGAYRLWRKHRK